MIVEQLKHLSVEIDSIYIDPANARSHSKKNIDAVKSSMIKFGQRTPIVVQRDGMIVRAGNCRLEAAKDLGWKEIAALIIDDDDITATAYAIADNRTGELATWDVDILSDLMQTLDDDLKVGWDEIDLKLFEPFDSDIPTSPTQETDVDNLDDMENLSTVEAEQGDTVESGLATLICGDCVEELSKMEGNSIDSICTDPPYGIGFMGSDWDCDVPSKEWARECLRVLKPGGHLVAFAATRTIHRLTTSLEDAGFEIRDMISWLQWQGFPKSMKVENLPGWGTALKPAQEPAVMARKPLDGTVAENVLKWGTGAINVDACRIPNGDPSWPGPRENDETPLPDGRWPANIYVCPKPPRREKEEGCESLDAVTGSDAVKRKENSAGMNSPRAGAGRTASTVKNHHPTVKPINLMRWLIRLITPKNGIVVDTFLGSGTTCVASSVENIRSIGIEKEPKYFSIARARVEFFNNETRKKDDG